MSQHKKQAHQLRFYKLMAQTVGLFVSIFFLLYTFGDGMPEQVKGEGKSWFPFLIIVLLPMIGYCIAWFKEQIGLALMTIGSICIIGYFLYLNDVKTGLIYGLPFLVSAFLFYLHLYKKGQLQHKSHIK
ncbi:MAG: hypothetical protein WCJ85_05520 [Chitinophagaceae bacterium]